MFERLTQDNLIWFPELGIGYYPVRDFPYDQDYFAKYQGYASTERGVLLTRTRVAFVAAHFAGNVLDVGIGCGQFVAARQNTCGFDVNPVALEWLRSRGLYLDLYENEIDALTFWDSLEHIEYPERAICQAKKWVFLSLPIFDDVDDVRNSKHYRKDEHFWYFTHNGLCAWFAENGFDLVTCARDESLLGRDSILTYAFKRRRNG